MENNDRFEFWPIVKNFTCLTTELSGKDRNKEEPKVLLKLQKKLKSVEILGGRGKLCYRRLFKTSDCAKLCYVNSYYCEAEFQQSEKLLSSQDCTKLQRVFRSF